MKQHYKPFNILLVDDHPLILDGYRNLIKENLKGYSLNIFTATDSKSGYNTFVTNNPIYPFDLIILDVNIPAFSEKKIFSGEDLGIRIRETSDTKIIVLTMHKDNFRIYNILRNLDPEGFMIKSDVDSEGLMKSVTQVLRNENYYSPEVIKVMKHQITSGPILDELDRGILYHLSRGIRTKELPNIIPLSLAAIEKRKRNLKTSFNIDGEGDLAMLDKAKQLGFL